MKTKVAIVYASIVITSALIAKPAFADTYRGGGYSVKIGDDGSYYGCDAKKRCLYIESYSHRNRGTYTWENKDFTYIMSPHSGGKYLLRVVNPQSKVILRRILS
jgi:hypothetical protein